jgi:hypothetical protein
MAAGYGWYKYDESVQLDSASVTLENNTMTSESIFNRAKELTKEHASVTHVLHDLSILQRYGKNPEHYRQLCSTFKRYRNDLYDISSVTQKDISTWQSTSKAQDFVQRARAFFPINKQRQHDVSELSTFLQQREHLITLAYLMDQEQKHVCRTLINKYLQEQKISVPFVQSCYPNSGWPLREAWSDLEKRKGDYQRPLDVVKAYTDPSEWSVQYAQKAEVIVDEYQKTQQAVSSLSEYNADLLKEKEFALRQQEINMHNRRIAAHEAQVAAQEAQGQAALRAAKAQEERTMDEKKKELNDCRKELMEIRDKIKTQGSDYNLESRKIQLKLRIGQLASEIPGESSFFDIWI